MMMHLLNSLVVFSALVSITVHADIRGAALEDRYEKMLEHSYPLYNPNDSKDLIAYAYEISSPEYAGSSTSGDIVFVPGFSIDAGTSGVSFAGSRSAYLKSFAQLKTTDFHSDVSPANALPREWKFDSYIDYLTTKLGYRVWLIDYVNNHARVQRNSLAVQALLRDPVFRFKSGSFDNHIFGYSMGGLVARHALLKLEQGGISHNLNSYVSLDAPHRGAFLPPSIEVVTRTIPRMANGGSAEFALTQIESEFRRYLQPLNSDAVKQLLGVYIGSGIPDMDTGGFYGRAKTADYQAYERLFSAIESDNKLAADPAFYELRQELIALGGYPSSTNNIGVSFGAEDGSALRAPSSRAFKPLEWDISQANYTLAHAEYFSSQADSLCRVEVAGRAARDCPPLRLSGGHLESIFISPGSTTPVYDEIAKGIRSDTALQSDTDSEASNSPLSWRSDPIGLLGSPVISTNGSATSNAVLHTGERLTTFIPTVSAWDDNGWAYTYMNADGQDATTVDTPFDLVLANSNGQSSQHTFITKELSQRIFASIANPLTLPGSSFFNAAGGFDIVRYKTLESPREIPLHHGDKAAPRLLPTHQIAALIALF